MSTPDKEWEDRVRLIMDEEEEDAAPAQDVPLPTEFPEIDWSQQSTPQQDLEVVVALESSGIRVPMETKARLLGLSAADLNRSVNNLDREEGVAVKTTTFNERGMPPGVVYEYSFAQSNNRAVAWAADKLLPGTTSRIQFMCGGCKRRKERALSSWQIAGVLSKNPKPEQVNALMQRFADSGCTSCQYNRIGFALQQTQVDVYFELGYVQARTYCPICGVERLEQEIFDIPYSTAERTKITQENIGKTIVCRECLDIVDPTVYKDGEGLK